MEVLQRNEVWDLTNPPTGDAATITGIDTQTMFGSFTNDDFLENPGFTASGLAYSHIPSTGTEIDLANFGGGFENEWVDLQSFAGTISITDILITPFGNFTLF